VRKRKRGRSAALGAFLFLLTAHAVAQTAPAAAAPAVSGDTRQSLWGMIREGMQWPGFFIIAGSITLLALIVEHFITIRRATIFPAEQVSRTRQLIEHRHFRECADQLRKSSTYFARVMTAALEHGRHGFEAMHEAAVEKSSQLSGQLFRKVEYMNILGNLGPLLGLLGTVLGMIFAFSALGQGGGEAGADKLANGISLALVNTLLGLLLAVVGLAMFGVCRNRVDSLSTQATVEALDLLEHFRPIPTAAAPAPAAAAPIPLSPPVPAGP
jgi:biopolymer transport protein ExbB